MPSPDQSHQPHALHVEFLGSGSSGNATVVTDGETTLLIDCGFSARETARRLAAHGIDANQVAAILITHEHADHVSGVEVFARRFGCSVWATAGARRAGRLDAKVDDIECLRAGEQRRVGTLDVLPFRSSHDAAEPVGFVLSSGSNGHTMRFGLATDIGNFTDEAEEALQGCDILGIECNHDDEMLARGPYPWFLKQRIASARGHLSNADAADALERVAGERLRQVYALHLSRTNNTHELARETLVSRVKHLGLDVGVESITQHCPVTQDGQATLFAE